MARGKVELKKVQNPVNRRVTFSKRKAGLLKKASELSLLCDAEVALIIFSPSGKLFEFANPSMNRAMGKYQNITLSTEHQTQSSENIETLRLEAQDLEKRMGHLEIINKHMIGEDLNSVSLKQLGDLEKKLNLSARKIHSRKDKISVKHIGSLKTKTLRLEAENLQKRMGHLEIINKHMIGKDLNSVSLKQLRHLEKNLNLGARKIHSTKDKISLEHIGSLKTKILSLKAEKANLDKKIGRRHKAREINIDISGGVNDDTEADAATQQIYLKVASIYAYHEL